MNAYREDYGDRLGTNMERIKLDLYLTYAPCGASGMDCARQLIEFAEEYKFELNIKVAALYYQNRLELRELMASPHCTVEAFTEEQDYRDLAEYLGFLLLENWKRPQATIDRDEETRQTLQRI